MRKDDRPAFPTTEYSEERPVAQLDGMHLRDYFASDALNGILASGKAPDLDALVENAYVIADLMMEQRRK